MDLKPKQESKLISSWRETLDIHEAINSIKEDTGAQYSDVMRSLIRLGLKSYEMPKKKKKGKAAPKVESTDFADCLDYLFEVTGRRFKVSPDLSARLAEYSPDEIKRVIEYKAHEWMGSDMQKYMRPQTLFNKTKFEGYLNDCNQQVVTNGNNKQQTETLAEQARSLFGDEKDSSSTVCENGAAIRGTLVDNH